MLSTTRLFDFDCASVHSKGLDMLIFEARYFKVFMSGLQGQIVFPQKFFLKDNLVFVLLLKHDLGSNCLA